MPVRKRQVSMDVSALDPPTPAPEAQLAAAVVKQLVADLRCEKPMPRKLLSTITWYEQLSCVEYLMDPHGGLAFWASALDLDPAWLQARIARAVGITL